MDSFPGGFPDMYPPSQQQSRTRRPGSATGNSDTGASIQSNAAPEDILLATHTRNTLNSRRKSFRKDIVLKLDILTYVYIFVVYLYDCSLLLLVLRVSVQVVTLVMQQSQLVRQLVPKNRGKRSTFQSIIITNFVCALTHYLRELPVPNDDGYIFGHHTLQSIGQKQLSDKRWLLALDAVLFYLQLLVFTSQYSVKRDENLTRESALELEQDCEQGRIIAMRLPLLSVLKLPYVDVDTLKAEDDQETEQLRRLDSQIDALLQDQGADQRQYGSVPGLI